jgi:alginate O-acetyltransferase complex protein AlgI
MLFNSIDFAIFLPIVFFLYWFVLNRNLKLQNALILFSSYVFYGWWDWRFLSLVLYSTIVDFIIGIYLGKETNPIKRKLLLFISIFGNIGLLVFFKYYNFFLDSFIEAFTFFGYEISTRSLNVILPVGISFYTFQTLSYSLDVYRKRLEPTTNFFAFSAFVTFFPQLVAGPIERATNLLPQFYKHRVFVYNKAIDGLRQILWGLFKKVVIADNAAEYANLIFNNSDHYSGSTLALGVFFFSIQIYCDFSGYSDIAIGAGRLFGFDLMRNFKFPYFSRDIAEFWRRWHISLSTWFRDYLYYPLGGSKGNLLNKVRNTFIIFLVSGFWHGANWTFILWGALNAIYFLPLLLLKKNRTYLGTVAEGKIFPTFREFTSMGMTFLLTLFAWIFFRANSIDHAFSIISEIFSGSFFNRIELPKEFLVAVGLIILFMMIEWLGRANQYAIAQLGAGWPKVLRWALYYSIMLAIFLFAGKGQDFIYFQF